MLRLNVLGAFELLDSAGAPLHRVLRHDKRVALLLYLAVAASRAAVRREQILPLFWPEHDAQGARAALRQALHLLRTMLGDEVLVTDANCVRVACDRIACDVLEFDTLVAARSYERALALYRGPMAPGFYVRCAAQFDVWLEQERRRLHQSALQCTLQLAGGSEGSDAEIAWLRRAQELAPYQEDIVRQLMGHYFASGNPALALAEYDDFVRRMSEEMELGVSETTRSLAAFIRQQCTPSAAGLRALG